MAESAVREIIGKTPIQFALTEGRARIEQDVAELIQQILDQYQAGIEVTQVQLQKVDPPQQVIDAFRDVQAAAPTRSVCRTRRKPTATTFFPVRAVRRRS